MWKRNLAWTSRCTFVCSSRSIRAGFSSASCFDVVFARLITRPVSHPGPLGSSMPGPTCEKTTGRQCSSELLVESLIWGEFCLHQDRSGKGMIAKDHSFAFLPLFWAIISNGGQPITDAYNENKQTDRRVTSYERCRWSRQTCIWHVVLLFVLPIREATPAMMDSLKNLSTLWVRMLLYNTTIHETLPCTVCIAAWIIQHMRARLHLHTFIWYEPAGNKEREHVMQK